ncbi:MAG: GTPase [Sulfolobales archaeon]|nr:50S ribosome-binding GTPase [Sulfolobales archaeon]MCX8208395.1 50S ribosome-binding GTPase [Sulfolobales archaeon]MDW8010586.1 GTPase [Sulfolobales archaeon]
MRFASWKLVRELVELSHVVLELTDSRDPLNTRSTKFEKIVSSLGKPLVVVINKADLVPKEVCEEWKEYFKKVLGYEAVYVSARSRLGTRILRETIKRVAGKPGEKRSRVVVSVFGLPKVGKSTLVNVLKGRHSTPTSPYPGSPGYTFRAKLFKIGEGIYLIDTPGIVPPEGGDVESVIRSKPIDELENPEKVAVDLILKVLKYNRRAFLEAYGVESEDPHEIIAGVARLRGWIRGGGLDLFEASKKVIRDYLDGEIVYYYSPLDMGLAQ